MSKETEKQIQEADERLENIESSLNKSEQFLEEHQTQIVIAVGAIIAVFALFFLAKNYYFEPMKEDAQKEMFTAQYYFEADSFALALRGDGLNKGFLDIIDEYSSTPAGELAQYYAGVCYLHLRDFENAKDCLKKYSSDDVITSSFAMGLAGDAEVELGNSDEAISCYKKAIAYKSNVTAPIFLIKLGNLYENNGNKEEAAKAYKQVKDDFPASAQVSLANKHLQSVQ